MLDKTKDLLQNVISRASLLFKEEKKKYLKIQIFWCLLSIQLHLENLLQPAESQAATPTSPLIFQPFSGVLKISYLLHTCLISLTSVGEKFPLKTRKKKNPNQNPTIST